VEKDALTTTDSLVIGIVVRVDCQNKNNPRRFIEDENGAEAIAFEFKGSGAALF
jgi:hypothetical protein